ncbi:MAG: DUF4956 domain-containing protein [Spirosomataceae bacterium]
MIFLQQLNTSDAVEGFQWFNKLSDKFFIRLSVDLITTFVLIRFIYYRIYKKADLFLTFFTFNLIIFLITYLLNKVQMSIGAAFGLFAVFSMLRYRTEGLSAKDMTYLFVLISIGLISAIIKGSWDELGLINGIILISIQLLEGNWLIRREFSKIVLYDRIELIHADKQEELLEDLKNRTGLEVHRVEINEVDFLKDAGRLTVYYYPSKRA